MSTVTDWRGQWLSLHDLAALMGKSYSMIYKMQRDKPTICDGILVVRDGYRIWARVDESTYQSLLNAS